MYPYKIFVVGNKIKCNYCICAINILITKLL